MLTKSTEEERAEARNVASNVEHISKYDLARHLLTAHDLAQDPGAALPARWGAWPVIEQADFMDNLWPGSMEGGLRDDVFRCFFSEGTKLAHHKIRTDENEDRQVTLDTTDAEEQCEMFVPGILETLHSILFHVAGYRKDGESASYRTISWQDLLGFIEVTSSVRPAISAAVRTRCEALFSSSEILPCPPPKRCEDGLGDLELVQIGSYRPLLTRYQPKPKD